MTPLCTRKAGIVTSDLFTRLVVLPRKKSLNWNDRCILLVSEGQAMDKIEVEGQILLYYEEEKAPGVCCTAD